MSGAVTAKPACASVRLTDASCNIPGLTFADKTVCCTSEAAPVKVVSTFSLATALCKYCGGVFG